MRSVTTKYLLILLVVLVSMVFLFILMWPRDELFSKVILNPIPASVKGVRSYSHVSLDRSHQYVLRFYISKADVPFILAIDNFQRVAYVTYDATYGLSYGDSSSSLSSFILFKAWEDSSVPGWFGFRTLDGYEAYLAEDKDYGHEKIRVFLYNETTGQAYFIEDERYGPGVGLMPPNPTNSQDQEER